VISVNDLDYLPSRARHTGKTGDVNGVRRSSTSSWWTAFHDDHHRKPQGTAGKTKGFGDAGKSFSLPLTQDRMLAFSRILYDKEVLIVYNESATTGDEEYIAVDSRLNAEGSVFRFCYGDTGKVHVLKNEDDSHHFVRLSLKPSQFVILTNQSPS